jgi:Kef-type K+ transport system membrane component KefB
MNNTELAVQFFLQIAVILFVCRLVGSVAARFGQPQVVAEMIAGVLLGPSLLGLVAPAIQQAIFPWDPTQQTRDSQSYLFPASQLGLALYMFIVGMEFRVDVVKSHLKSSIAVSIAGMAAPFLLGAGLAAWFFYQTDLFPPQTTLNQAMLFLGASMCITAFPMLARIIHFKGLAGTLMGTVAIGAGAIDDVTAWCLLAVVLASFDDNASQALYSIGGGVVFVLVAVALVRPLLLRIRDYVINPSGQLSDVGLSVGLGCMALGAWFTDLIHLHAVFGSFVMGAMIPRGAFSTGLTNKIQPLAVGLLLPLFFTYSGLNTKIGLLNSWYLWGMCLLVFVAAVVGKGVACSAAARWSGLSTRDALGIGTLMNARGLMELIIINIGLQRGVISEELFACLVIMAIITTLMASPIFDLIVGNDVRNEPAGASPNRPSTPSAIA